ncbi:MAG: PIN domain-containing protein [Oscillospiraceae bacterium]|nr:PIN domain-containing protein [Oscillospiraceae bacterium]
MIILDANMILRLLTDDVPEQAERAEKIIDNNRVLLLPEVAAEVVFALRKFYQEDRVSAASDLLKLIEIDNVETEHGNVLHRGLQLYRDTSLDFVDCLLAAYHLEEDYDICTFDKKLQKLIERIDPQK